MFMNLRELMQYIAHSKGKKDLLNLMLIEPVENLVTHKNIHLS